MEDSNHKGPDAPEVLQLKRDLASAQGRIARLEAQVNSLRIDPEGLLQVAKSHSDYVEIIESRLSQARDSGMFLSHSEYCLSKVKIGTSDTARYGDCNCGLNKHLAILYGTAQTEADSDIPDSEMGRDWPADFPYENGNYHNTCLTCGENFMGHKRRVTCRICAGTKDKTLLQRHMEANAKFPPCKCGGAAVGNASGDITRTCIRCGAIVLPVPQTKKQDLSPYITSADPAVDEK